MKLICTILFIGFNLITPAIGQTTNQKIKVVLLGTFHYGATSDRTRTPFPDLFSEKRQSELALIAKQLVQIGVNKFFLETPVSRQKKQDSLYTAYTSKKLTDTVILRDEEIQIAFRTAAINNAKLIASDNRQELPFDQLNEYDKLHEKDTAQPYPFFSVKYPFTQKQPKLNELPLTEYYIQLNNPYNRQAHMFDYLHYALSYGEDQNFVGEAFALSWYDRNLKIFTNILRNIDIKNDKVIVVLFGSSHTALLRHFFEDHPYFEIVELTQVFR